MAERSGAPAPAKNSHWLVLAASLLYTTVASYVAMNRDDAGAVTNALQSLRDRVITIESKIEERRLSRDREMGEMRARLDGLERRDQR